MSVNPRVSVIIPTLRAGNDLRRALESLGSDKTAPPHEVVVVFNAPIPSDIEVSRYHPCARALENMRNLGFAKACNLGAKESEGEFLAFINDDMVVGEGWLDALLTRMRESETLAAGGRILSENGKYVDFGGGSINIIGWGFQIEHGEPVEREGFVVRDVLPFACGGNFAIKRSLFEEAGGFDGGYFAFYEDVDLGWRLHLMGHNIAYAPDAVTFHSGGATGSLMPSPLKWFLQERNALQTIIKNYSGEVLWRVLPIAFALVCVRAQILSGLDSHDFVDDRTWHEWVLGESLPEFQEKEGRIWQGLLDSVKESLKAGMKAARKASLPHGYLPIESRSAGGIYALEWCLRNWDEIMEKREKVQMLRKREDREIIATFEDPLRPVLGHPREVEAMSPLEGILNEILGN